MFTQIKLNHYIYSRSATRILLREGLKKEKILCRHVDDVIYMTSYVTF